MKHSPHLWCASLLVMLPCLGETGLHREKSKIENWYPHYFRNKEGVCQYNSKLQFFNETSYLYWNLGKFWGLIS